MYLAFPKIASSENVYFVRHKTIQIQSLAVYMLPAKLMRIYVAVIATLRSTAKKGGKFKKGSQ